MSQSQPGLEELQARKAIAEAETAAIEAELARDEAKLKLTDSHASADSAKLSQQARVNAAKDAKEVADAEKALADAELAALTAKIGEVPSSGISGSVKVEQGAASFETTLLAARSTIVAAKTVAKSVVAAAKGDFTTSTPTVAASAPEARRIFVFAAGEVPDFQATTAFLAQRAIVLQALVNAVTQANQAKKPAVGSGAEESVAAVGVALEAVTKILGFFRSDFEVRGNEVSADSVLLATAVSGELILESAGSSTRVYLKAMFDPEVVAAAESMLSRELESLNFQRSKASTTLGDMDKDASVLQSELSKITGDSPADRERRRQLGEQQERVRNAIERLKGALTAYDTFVAKLASPDANVAAMTREHELWSAISNPSSFVLVVKMVKAGGSNYVQKDLWTNLFGVMPYKVMGGVVASYACFQGSTGALLASGVVPVHGGFYDVSRVGDVLK